MRLPRSRNMYLSSQGSCLNRCLQHPLLFHPFLRQRKKWLTLRGGLVEKMCQTLEIPWTVARYAPLSMGFPRQENWSRLSFLSPEYLPNPGIEPESLVSPACGRRILYRLSHQGRLMLNLIQKALTGLTPGFVVQCPVLLSTNLQPAFISSHVVLASHMLFLLPGKT